MRYTTIIDITEVERVWHSMSARNLYLYMCLKCGYQDSNRDIMKVSIRNLAYRTNMTVSAVRHAIAVLQSSGLLRVPEPGHFIVTKWVPSERPGKRPKSSDIDPKAAEIQDRIREREERQIERRNQSESGLEVYLKQLKAKADAGDKEAAKLYKLRSKQL